MERKQLLDDLMNYGFMPVRQDSEYLYSYPIKFLLGLYVEAHVSETILSLKMINGSFIKNCSYRIHIVCGKPNRKEDFSDYFDNIEEVKKYLLEKINFELKTEYILI